jgi:hypothetical protein
MMPSMVQKTSFTVEAIQWVRATISAHTQEEAIDTIDKFVTVDDDQLTRLLGGKYNVATIAARTVD